MPCKLRDATCRCHSVGQPGAQRCRAAHLDEQAHAARLHVCLHARGGQVAADCDVQLQRARACVLAQRKLPATLVLLHQARALLRAPRRLAHVFLGSWAPWHRLNLLSGDAPSQQLAGEQRRWLRFVRLCKVAQQAGLRKRPAHAPRALGSPCVAAAAAARRLGARPWRGGRGRVVAAAALRLALLQQARRRAPGPPHVAVWSHVPAPRAGLRGFFGWHQRRSPVRTGRLAPVQRWRPGSHRLWRIAIGRGALLCQQQPRDILRHSTGPQAPRSHGLAAGQAEL